MGRTKHTPQKRQRTEVEIITDQEKHKNLKEQNEAIAALLSAPQADVEKAAAKATSDAIKLWPRLDDIVKEMIIDGGAKDKETNKNNGASFFADVFRGLGWCKLPIKDMEIFQKLHDTIKTKTSENQTSWSGSIEDPRRRSFGFLPDTLGSKDDIREKYLDISTPFLKDDLDTNELIKDERGRNQRATVILSKEDKSNELNDALDRTIEKFKKQVEKTLPDSKYKQNILQYFKKETLIAAQPNLHNGRLLLPSHVDHPTKDGFGVIIITIAMKGTADIMLQDYENKTKGVFTLNEGEAYMLCDRVRNECSHGVLAKEGSENRESLNLRFGLHDLSSDGFDDKDIAIDSGDILKYWN